MSIEGFNNRKTRNTKITALSKFMTAVEARNELDTAITNLALKELTNAIEKVKADIAKGKNTVIFVFSYFSSSEVIAATIGMLRDLGYEVKMSENCNDLIHITVK